MTQLAFAAERRAAAPCCGAPAVDRYFLPRRRSAAEPAARRGSCRMTGQTNTRTDRQTNGRTLDRFIEPVPPYYASTINR